MGTIDLFQCSTCGESKRVRSGRSFEPNSERTPYVCKHCGHVGSSRQVRFVPVEPQPPKLSWEEIEAGAVQARRFTVSGNCDECSSPDITHLEYHAANSCPQCHKETLHRVPGAQLRD
jgi:predicted RNA-binding Zn-ribbon protein involved in translation (DUF1610 family)